jgi:hypothetical protein
MREKSDTPAHGEGPPEPDFASIRVLIRAGVALDVSPVTALHAASARKNGRMGAKLPGAGAAVDARLRRAEPFRTSAELLGMFAQVTCAAVCRNGT